MIEVSLQDVFILTKVFELGCVRKYNGCTTREIIELAKEYKHANNVSDTTIRGYIKKLVDRGYLGNGLKRGRYNTFYVTEQGNQFLNEINN